MHAWRWKTIGGAVCLIACGVLAEACSTDARYRILSTVFDGVPPPGTPPKERRRPRALPEEPSVAELETALQQPTSPIVPGGPTDDPLAAGIAPSVPGTNAARAGPDFESFAQLVAAFPNDGLGNADWVAAVQRGLIQPRASLDPTVKAMDPFPLEVRLDPGVPNFEVVFPHAAHTYWLRCDNCHPQIFQMKAGADPITMASIFQGNYCGRCHGKVAFAPQTGCPRCHVQMARKAG